MSSSKEFFENYTFGRRGSRGRLVGSPTLNPFTLPFQPRGLRTTTSHLSLIVPRVASPDHAASTSPRFPTSTSPPPSHRLTKSAPAAISTYCYLPPSQWRALMRGPDLVLPTTPGTFKFLSLPGEIRNMIYRCLLLATFPLQLIQDRPAWPDLPIPGEKLGTAILCVNRQVHNEAASILYGENTWYVHPHTTPCQFVQDVRDIFQTEVSLASAPLTLYMPFIKRVVMSSNSPMRFQKRMDIVYSLQGIGIRFQDLEFFAIYFSSDYTCQKIADANKTWLMRRDAKMWKSRLVWFPEGVFPDETWLVKKSESDEKTTEQIPGLGVLKSE